MSQNDVSGADDGTITELSTGANTFTQMSPVHRVIYNPPVTVEDTVINLTSGR